MRRYDFWLVMLTVALLVAMGILAFGGTLFTWRAETVEPGWSGSSGYVEYARAMDVLVTPLVAALTIVLGLCIPRRLLDRTALWSASAGMVGASLAVAAFAGLRAGAAVFLGVSALMQLVALVMTAARAGRLTYLAEGPVYQIGSALLHLGFVVLVFDWVVMPDAPQHVAVFWAGTGMLVVGSALCFYRSGLGRLARGLPRRPT